MKFNNSIISVLRRIFPRFERAIESDNKEYELVEVERNELCYCGSSLKYKKCHLAENIDNQVKAYHKIDKEGVKSIVLIKRKRKSISVKNTLLPHS